MANLTINFNAQTTGIHYVAVKETHLDVNYTMFSVNVVTPGPHNAVLNVPGSLYCGELHYEGWIAAECQGLTQAEIDGTAVDPPTSSIPFQVTLDEQEDPCVATTFTCDNVPVITVVITQAGTGYAVNDVLPFVEATLGDEVAAGDVTVASIGGLGEITGITISNGGSFKAAPTVDATGSGDGAAVITVTQMAICNISDLNDIICLTLDASKDNWQGLLGESFTACAESSLEELQTVVGTGFDLAQIGNCKCLGCEELSLDASTSTTGTALVQYNRCWDRDAGETLVQKDVSAGDSLPDLDCIIPETFVIISNSLDGALTTTFTPCSNV